MHIKRALLLLCLIAGVVSAQVIIRSERDTKRKYDVICAFTANAEVPSCVVHLPATEKATKVWFGSISVRSPEAGSVVFEWGGATPAGGTAAVVQKNNTTAAMTSAALMNATSASPAATRSFVISANTDYPFDVSDLEFVAGNVTGRTLRVTLSAAVTGTGQIIIGVLEGY